MSATSGHLIIIGGHEDKCHEQSILKEVAGRVLRSKGNLVIVTTGGGNLTLTSLIK